ncbi:sigma-70 family RNA polymerase sigma factor [Hazenella sp. IB182357]|uniref:Sigma-70 family RNA polymerase sigma factor n=1 Tax=Polycladospora coralii TaxID=2771432 RepID=A0A926N5J7_9BACL|nr:sigma-70 family RNA polymerase sigma factor [Polycladospora coralii]MBS7529315.1 sigma-70 family RNA polymerase sigma factor [Polycladospora coralii]
MDNWIKKAQTGDQDAFRKIVEAYEKKIYNLVLQLLKKPEEAKDVTQEVFIKIYTNLSRYRAEAQFSTWAYQITYRTCMDRLRKKQKEQTLFPPQELDENQTKIDHVSVEARYEQRELREQLQETLDQLPDKYRMVLILSHQQELSYQEIADILEMPVNTVGTHLYRAKLQLRKLLGPLRERGMM